MSNRIVAWLNDKSHTRQLIISRDNTYFGLRISLVDDDWYRAMVVSDEEIYNIAIPIPELLDMYMEKMIDELSERAESPSPRLP